MLTAEVLAFCRWSIATDAIGRWLLTETAHTPGAMGCNGVWIEGRGEQIDGVGVNVGVSVSVGVLVGVRVGVGVVGARPGSVTSAAYHASAIA